MTAGDQGGGVHPGDLALRRHRAGEPAPADVAAHLAGCGACRARLRAVDDEQRRFESQISFDRFAAGVERAARTSDQRRRAGSRAGALAAVAMAAAVAIVVIVRVPAGSPVPIGIYAVEQNPRGDHLKGGAGMTVRVAGPSGQRTARVDADEPLARGERLRIGYQPGPHRYVLSLSVDQSGTVTALYPEDGASLPVPDGVRGEATAYLPDSLELTGAGLERIFVLLSDAPIDMATARAAARAAYDRAGGELGHLTRLQLPAEEFTRTFNKP